MSKTKSGRSTRKVANTLYVVVVTIERGQLSVPGGVDTFARGPVVWIVKNKDDAAYTVQIDYTKIVHKSNGKHEHPFAKDQVRKAHVNATKRLATIVDVIRDYQPSTTRDSYDYTVDLVHEKGKQIDTLDPDLDVVDPGSILQM
jgi:hypothetical protein